MLKRILCLAICLAVLILPAGCLKVEDYLTDNIEVSQGDDYRTVTLKAQGVSLEIPKNWSVDMTDTELDLFCSGGVRFLSLYTFKAEEITNGASFKQVWNNQNKTALENYDKANELNHTPDFEADDKEFDTVLYSAEVEGIDQYLYYIFVKEKGNEDMFLWLGFSGFPSDVRDNFELFEDIADSVKFN